MAVAVEATKLVPWWKEPTRDQWYAWWAAWLGWTLDAFDFTVFLLIMVPIAKEFDVPLAAVAFVLTITLWMRLIDAVAAGWLADRIGRKTPLRSRSPGIRSATSSPGFPRPCGFCCCSAHC
jgi:MFS transporter, SHS family, lactate transporter